MFVPIFISISGEENLVKGVKGKTLDKTKLHKEKVYYRTKSGKMAMRDQWKLNDDVKVSKPKSTKPEPEKEHDSSSNDSTKSKRMYIPLSDCSKMSEKDKTVVKVLTQSDINQQLLIHYNKNKNKYKMDFHKFKNSKLAKDWLKANYFVSDGDVSTTDVYRLPNGEYTPERKKLHDKIVQQIVDSANSPKNGEKPVAILMGGGSASGKGTVRKSLVIPTLQAGGVNVGISDSDDIKELMPEYQPFKDQDTDSAARRVHDESSYIANLAIDALIKENKNLMFDGTMKNYDKYISLIDKLHDAGYEVQIVGVDTELNVAFERSDARAQHTGRKVPHSIISGSHGGFCSTLPQLSDKVDSCVLYDNSGPIGSTPEPIMIDGNIVDKDRYETFINKGEAYKVAKKYAKQYGLNFDKSSQLYLDILKYTKLGMSVEELDEYLDTMGLESFKELEENI